MLKRSVSSSPTETGSGESVTVSFRSGAGGGAKQVPIMTNQAVAVANSMNSCGQTLATDSSRECGLPPSKRAGEQNMNVKILSPTSSAVNPILPDLLSVLTTSHPLPHPP